MDDEEPTYRVTWTGSALADLDAITSFIAADNPAAAERIGRSILEHARLLVRFPFIGPVYSQIPGGLVREVVFRRTYRIFYSVDETLQAVMVLRVWHGARGEPDLSASPST